MIILIDNGHGYDTAGKCSPDGRIREYAWTRDIAKRLQEKLKQSGFDARLIVTEQNDISLRERCRRVNDICKRVGAKNCLLISIHINAAGGNGQWHTASGFSGWVAPNASSNSKRFAKLLHDEAVRLGLGGNRSVPPEKYWIGNFAIVRDTNCPAVLTENLFMDNKQEVDYLLSETGKETIVTLHYKAITNYISGKV